MAWWGDAWLSDPALQGRFEREAAAALPVPASASSEDIFAASNGDAFACARTSRCRSGMVPVLCNQLQSATGIQACTGAEARETGSSTDLSPEPKNLLNAGPHAAYTKAEARMPSR